MSTDETMTQESKPREFWIMHDFGLPEYEGKEFLRTRKDRPFTKEELWSMPQYHVIEMSAYRAIEAQLADAKEEIERLKEFEWMYKELCK